MGVPVHALSMRETLATVEAWLTDGQRPRLLVTLNPEMLMRARVDAAFWQLLQHTDLNVPDGIGLVWAMRRRGVAVPERVAGSDLFEVLCARAAQRGWRPYLLGAAPGVAEKAAAVLCARYPGLQVAGCYAGSPAPEEEEAIVARIRESGADILFLAYGSPQQELWLGRNLARTGARLGIGVGGAFNFVAGVTPRAPLWMRRAGLEWLHRLLHQPWRWRRQIVLPLFVWLVLTGRDHPRMGHEELLS